MEQQKEQTPLTFEQKIETNWRSRKFALTLFGLFLVSGFALLALKFSIIQTVYPTFIGGIIGIISVYFTGNVANKYVLSKSSSSPIIRNVSKNNEEKDEVGDRPDGDV